MGHNTCEKLINKITTLQNQLAVEESKLLDILSRQDAIETNFIDNKQFQARKNETIMC